MTEENKEEKDPIDELFDKMPENEGDEPEDKDKKKASEEQGEDDKPVTLKDLKAILGELKADKGSSTSSEELKKFKEEIQEMLEPVIKHTKNTELNKAVAEFEKTVQANIPHFEVDMDLLEYHMATGKSRKDALKMQVDKARAIAEKYSKKTDEPVDKKKPEDVDFSSFNPELHKDAKAFRKLKQEEKNDYWIKFNLFKRKNKE